MKSEYHRPVKRIRVSLQDKVAALLRNKAEQVNYVTFTRRDGTKIKQELRDAFLENKKPHIVIQDLRAIQHDLNAVGFLINAE